MPTLKKKGGNSNNECGNSRNGKYSHLLRTLCLVIGCGFFPASLDRQYLKSIASRATQVVNANNTSRNENIGIKEISISDGSVVNDKIMQQQQELNPSEQLRKMEQKLEEVKEAQQHSALRYNNDKGNKNNNRDSPPLPHPHAGARDADGYWGYVANVTVLHDWMVHKICPNSESNCDMYNNFSLFKSAEEMNEICSMPPGSDLEGPDGWDVLANIVSVNQSSMLLLPNDDNPTIPKVLCAIYSYDSQKQKIYGVAETWGWRCDGFFAASNSTVPYEYTGKVATPPVEIIDLPHQGEENYQNMWQKTRSILSYMHDNYIDDFDYFYLAGDDTHLIVENLKDFLMDHEKNKEKYGDTNPDGILYAGQYIINTLPDGSPIRHEEDNSYIEYLNGGPGYVLSKLALRNLVNEAFPSCHIDTERFEEDMIVGECMKQINVTGIHGIDESGKQLFHHVNSQEMCDDNFTQIFQFWAERFNSTSRGKDLVSPKSVSFHHLKTTLHMKRHHSILYKGSCPAGTILGDSFLNVQKQNKKSLTYFVKQLQLHWKRNVVNMF